MHMALKENEKLQRFADEVFSQADVERNQILKETQEQHEKLLEEGTRKIREEAKAYLAGEIKELRRKNSQQLSKHTMQLRKDLLLYRENLIQNISEKVTERICAFTQSSEYKDYLIKLCINVLRSQEADFVLYLSENDMKYKADILGAVSNNSDLVGRVTDILPEKNIKLGGIRFWSVSKGILINETIDENLEHQREYFIKLIGPVSKVESNYS